MQSSERASSRIRGARLGEQAELTELALRSKAYWGYDASFMAACRAELTVILDGDDAHVTYVLEEGQTIVGFYALQEIGSGRLELAFLFVEPDAIGRGYGKALIEHAKQQTRSAGHRVLVIASDPHAAAFYRAAGARFLEERPSDSIEGRLLPVFEIDVSHASKSANDRACLLTFMARRWSPTASGL
ncbi:MAG: hypothetical protein RLZZ450_1050 [Pseudomonadota bacterium]|jgi:GNAT superfamily N-acetyltransferase